MSAARFEILQGRRPDEILPVGVGVCNRRQKAVSVSEFYFAFGNIKRLPACQHFGVAFVCELVRNRPDFKRDKSVKFVVFCGKQIVYRCVRALFDSRNADSLGFEIQFPARRRFERFQLPFVVGIDEAVLRYYVDSVGLLFCVALICYIRSFYAGRSVSEYRIVFAVPFEEIFLSTGGKPKYAAVHRRDIRCQLRNRPLREIFEFSERVFGNVVLQIYREFEFGRTRQHSEPHTFV